MHPWYKHPDHLSPTSVSRFMRCPRRWFYYRLGLESKEPKAALVYGTAMHHAFGLISEGKVSEAIEAFNKVWDEALANNKRSMARARMQLLDFANTHQPGKSLYKLVAPIGGVRVPERVSDWEVPFAIDIGLPVPVVGRIDGVGRHRDTGELWAVEFKTSGQLGSMFLSGFAMDPQILTYTLALASYATEKVQGTIVDGMLVAASKTEAMCLPVYVRGHSLEDCVEWYKEAWKGIEVCANNKPVVPGAGGFNKNIAGCTTYPSFGSPGYVCEYQALCLAGSAWEDMIGLFDHKEPREFEILGDDKESET